MSPAKPPQRTPEQMIDLYWGEPRRARRGPQGSLSVRRVVEAAVAVADAEGLAAVSMRRVAESLGVTTMSLYRYVPGRQELSELMLDHVGEPPDPAALPDGRRPRLAAIAGAMRARYHRHPWMLDVAITGPPMGPNTLGWMEAILATLEETGLSAADGVLVLTVLTGYIRYDSGVELSMAKAESRTGISAEEWGSAYGRVLANVVDDGRFPALSRAVAAGVFSHPSNGAEDFAWGLEFVLDGVDALIASRAPGRPGGAGTGARVAGPDAAAPAGGGCCRCGDADRATDRGTDRGTDPAGNS
ncbi:TetR/AcrR family transcriptional regulator C-terminal domain-containing protein [Streptomyces lonarensis]|uniref:TetR/AcrR family transcriptional regulator C-terminal domain-containing protein n=1 Tax=Streptomyces lonarensis TaxID=700599 RepID=UPI0030C76A0B